MMTYFFSRIPSDRMYSIRSRVNSWKCLDNHWDYPVLKRVEEKYALAQKGHLHKLYALRNMKNMHFDQPKISNLKKKSMFDLMVVGH